MEIRQLEYFCAVVEAGTISSAARNLHMTQPPLSYQIKMLEEELQVPLFQRGTKRITLTEAGKALYVRAESLLTMADITKREVRKVSQAATLHIGMTPSTVSMMTEKLANFAASHPEIRFDIHKGSTFVLKNQLENGIVDITTLRTPIAIKGFEVKTLVRELLLAMSVTAPQKKSTITLKELSEKKIILSHRYRKYLLDAFEKEGFFCDIYCECEDARTAMTLAENNLGIAILPASMREMSDKIYACQIEGAKLETEILLAWRNEKMPREVKEFLEDTTRFAEK